MEVAIRRREPTQEGDEAQLDRRELVAIELRGEAEWVVVQRVGPRRGTRVRRGRETHELLEELAIRDAERVGVGWLVAHGTYLCVDPAMVAGAVVGANEAIAGRTIG
jgi:hypothetical protein